MANRTTKLIEATGTATGASFLPVLLRNGRGVFVVEYTGTLGTFTVVLEGRAVPGTGQWAEIARRVQTDLASPNQAAAVDVALLPEVRARVAAFTGITNVSAFIVE